VFCTINPNGINQITFVMETHLVYCAVGNDFFNPFTWFPVFKLRFYKILQQVNSRLYNRHASKSCTSKQHLTAKAAPNQQSVIQPQTGIPILFQTTEDKQIEVTCKMKNVTTLLHTSCDLWKFTHASQERARYSFLSWAPRQ